MVIKRVQSRVMAGMSRGYTLTRADVPYVLSKGLSPLMRGLLWEVARLRAPSGLMLGRSVVFCGGRYLDLGRGISIGSFSYLECFGRRGVKLGDGVTIRESCWIQCRSGLNAPGEGLVVGDGTYIGPFTVLGVGGLIAIGANVQIGAGVMLSAEAHERGNDETFTSGCVTRRGIIVDDDVWIGNGVRILDGVRIGRGAAIGAGAVVREDVAPFAIVAGVPARPVSGGSRELLPQPPGAMATPAGMAPATGSARDR